MEIQCWERTREKLGLLFDESDYSTALALVYMQAYSTCVKADPERGSYYGTLARTMCEKIGRTNSPAFLRVLCFDSIYVASSCYVIVEEFHNQAKRAQALAYRFVMTKKCPKLREREKNAEEEEEEKKEQESEEEEEEEEEDGEEAISLNLMNGEVPISFTLSIALTVLRIHPFLDRELLKALARKVGEMYRAWQSLAKTTTKNEKGNGKGNGKEKEKEIEKGNGEESIKFARKFFIELLFYGVLTELYSRLGNCTEAVRWAKKYVDNAEHPLYICMPTVYLTCVGILQTLFECQEINYFEKLLVILRQVKDKVPTLASLLLPYELQLYLYKRS